MSARACDPTDPRRTEQVACTGCGEPCWFTPEAFATLPATSWTFCEVCWARPAASRRATPFAPRGPR